MTKKERIEFRVTKPLKDKAEAIAEQRGVNLSELLVDYIKGLPRPKAWLEDSKS